MSEHEWKQVSRILDYILSQKKKISNDDKTTVKKKEKPKKKPQSQYTQLKLF